MHLKDKKILLIVSGGIAAYKSAELCRLLQKEGAVLRVSMTKAAQQFIAPLTFQALTGFPVSLDLLSMEEESSIGHIGLARWAELILVAPATANFIARIAAGICDDVPTTVIFAGTQPVLFCPAMNVEMWKNPILQKNISYLNTLERYQFVPPSSGDLACGETGVGRLAEFSDILAVAKNILAP